MNKIKNIHVFGGGTVNYIADHLAISAPAYGTTARKIAELCEKNFPTCNVKLELTNMALGGHGPLNTVEDVDKRIDELIADPNTMAIFFSCAIADYAPTLLYDNSSTLPHTANIYTKKFGKYINRPATNMSLMVQLEKTSKIIQKIRKTRKDIFLVGFKTTVDHNNQEMYLKGLKLLKEASCNLVLVNDTKRRFNMIITPEEAAYHETYDRDEVLKNLVAIAWYRSHLKFTQSTVIEGSPIPWSDERIPANIREVVNYCIENGAYKEFNGATVGHFAIKLSDTEFLTSIRKSNFNDIENIGMVYVKTNGPDTVLAYGAKPSVGGQSQRTIFRDHEGMDCIVHFHCPLKETDHINYMMVISQREVECGSHECGKNTSKGLMTFNLPDGYSLKAVMLNKHGPNIVFNKNVPAKFIIQFIEKYFDLSKKTGGYNLS